MRELAKKIIINRMEKSIHQEDINIMLLPGSMEGKTVGVLIFDSKSNDPLFFIKVYREESPERMLKEKTILQKLKELNNKNKFISPLYIDDGMHNNSPYLAQSILPGDHDEFNFSKNSHLQNMKLKKQLFNITDALIDLASIEYNADCSKTFEIGSIINEYNLTFGSVSNKIVLDIDIEYLKMKTIINHNDFVPHNILLNSSDIEPLSVIDWTDVNLCGLPFFDLFNFYIHLLMRLRISTSIKDLLSTFHYGFFEKNDLSAIFLENIKLYASKVSIEPNYIRQYFYIFLMYSAVQENRKVRESIEDNNIPSHIFSMNESTELDNLKLEYWSEYFAYTQSNQNKLLL